MLLLRPCLTRYRADVLESGLILPVVEALAESGPMTVTVDSVVVPERQEDRRWQVQHSISLARDGATPS